LLLALDEIDRPRAAAAVGGEGKPDDPDPGEPREYDATIA
jgi:hypothetical protein